MPPVAHPLPWCRIRESTIVIAGFPSGIAHELVKNLALKGVGTIILLTWPMRGPSFDVSRLLFQGHDRCGDPSPSPEEMAKTIIAHAHELNPSVALRHDHLTSIHEVTTGDYLTEGAGAISMFFLINEANYEASARRVGDACRRAAIPFQWLLTHAMQAVLISDLGPLHVYEEERGRVEPETGEVIRETTTKSVAFLQLSDLWRRHSTTVLAPESGSQRRPAKADPVSFSPVFREIQRQVEANEFLPGSGRVLDEVPAVNAIMGAIAAQEAVKVVTGKDLPIHNVVLFDGATLDSTIVSVSQ